MQAAKFPVRHISSPRSPQPESRSDLIRFSVGSVTQQSALLRAPSAVQNDGVGTGASSIRGFHDADKEQPAKSGRRQEEDRLRAVQAMRTI